ncbi:MAG: hypothetical protein U0894_14470 [Pirellulales bacterium]
MTGRLPTDEETQSFLASQASDKREQVIDSLLRSPEAWTLLTSGQQC